MQVAACDVQAICRARLKADAAAALDPGDKQAAAAVVRGLQRVAEEAADAGCGRLGPLQQQCGAMQSLTNAPVTAGSISLSTQCR